MDKAGLNTKLKECYQSMLEDKIDGKIKDLPRVLAACSASVQDPNYYVGWNHQPTQSEYDQRFLDRVDQVFPGKTIGEHTLLAPWPIGQCAEQHAANTVLKHDSNAIIDELQFSDAIKTSVPLLPFPYCANCKAIFKQLI